jgi:hypothetical protein
MNRLQKLDTRRDLFVTLNPVRAPRPERVIRTFDYTHPLFDAAALSAQQELWRLQGQRNTWFCGSYFGYGFHEDALQSGLPSRWRSAKRRRGRRSRRASRASRMCPCSSQPNEVGDLSRTGAARALRPGAHKLTYRVFSLLIDLDELGALDAVSAAARHQPAGLLSFRESDHGDGVTPLRKWAGAAARDRGSCSTAGASRCCAIRASSGSCSIRSRSISATRGRATCEPFSTRCTTRMASGTPTYCPRPVSAWCGTPLPSSSSCRPSCRWSASIASA